MTALLLKLHRWVGLLFALPLVFVLGSGLVLSFEPWLVGGAIHPGLLTAEKIQAILAQHDAQHQAKQLSFRSYDHTLTLGTGRGGASTMIDIDSGQVVSEQSALADVLITARRIHERLLIDARWVVWSSSAAMLVLATLGVLMGLPRLSNTLSGWHKAIAWGLLPLIVLSPLTGLFLANNITFMGPAPASSPAAAPISLLEAVQIVGQNHDLSTLMWIRSQGGQLRARLDEAGEYRVYAVTPEGMTALPRNWPRLWHEGDFAGIWSSLINVVTSIAMIGLLLTGPLMWIRRQLRRRAQKRSSPAQPADGTRQAVA